jgi:hypothetical protein
MAVRKVVTKSLMLAVAIGVLGLATAYADAPLPSEIRGGDLTLRVSSEGRIVEAAFGSQRVTCSLSAETVLGGCREEGAAQVRGVAGSVEVTRRLVHDTSKNRCVLVERFLPAKNSVRWEIEIRGQGGPWTTAIETRLAYPAGAESRFWTTWGDADNRHDRWQDPLVWRPLVERAWPYQFVPLKEEAKASNCISMPLVTLAEPRHDAALSLVLSPEDTELDLSLTTTPQGQITFSRSNHRIGSGRTVHFAADLVSHPADPRGGLGWMVDRYPEFFNPPNPAADAMAGCGAYSGSEEHFDVEKLRQMAFRINWKCSEDFPYMGMFLPPMPDAKARWDRAPDEKTPGKPSWTSYQTLEDYNRWMRAHRFHVLSYFNVTEYGRNMKFPPPPRKAERDEDLWRDPHDYLYQSDRRAAVVMQGDKPVMSNCYRAVIVDPGQEAYQRHLLEQARRHLEKLPGSDGICIDRLDWLGCYNRNADDGVSWIDGRPARSLYVSWSDLMDKLGPLEHQAGKVIFVNNCVARIETMRHVDGIYAEWTYSRAMAGYFNYSALAGVRKPVMVWTADEKTLTSVGADAYMQRCLYLGVFPTAPYPLNNHCLRPSPLADAAYLDYGPLLDSLRGKKWVLRPHAVEVAGEKAKANLFEVPGGYVVPVVFGGEEPKATVILRGLSRPAGSKGFRVEAICPGQDRRMPVAATDHGDRIVLGVPLVRGCAMVKLWAITD